MAQILVGVDTSNSITAIIPILSSFLSSNGWTIDRQDSNRLHFHKSSYHFEIYGTSSYLYIIGCTGYTSGNTYDNQPGTGPSTYVTNGLMGSTSSPRYYTIISTTDAVVIFSSYANFVSPNNFAFGAITSKIGTWTGGQFYSGGYGNIFGSTAYSYASLFFNGSWTPFSIAGGVNGLTDICASLQNRQPFTYSNGIMPLPILMFKRDSTTTTMFHPVGIFSDILRFRGGDVYAQGDIITIDGNQHIAVNYGAGCDSTAVPDFLVKVL
jgi:hypothetical protein